MGPGAYQTMEETENLSMISSVSTHQAIEHTRSGSDDFAEAHNSPDILTGRSERADKPLGAMRREKENESKSARKEKHRRDRRGIKSQTPMGEEKRRRGQGHQQRRQQQQHNKQGQRDDYNGDDDGAGTGGNSFAEWWTSTFSPPPPSKQSSSSR